MVANSAEALETITLLNPLYIAFLTAERKNQTLSSALYRPHQQKFTMYHRSLLLPSSFWPSTVPSASSGLPTSTPASDIYTYHHDQYHRQRPE